MMSNSKSHNDYPDVSLITGAGGGIGSAITLKFLEEGLKVCATDADKEKLCRLNSIKSDKRYADNIFTIPMDVCNKESIVKAEQIVSDKWGRVNVLVNCAGIFRLQPFLDMSDDSFGEVIRINLIGTFMVSQVFVREMINNGGGKIINIASVSAFLGPSHASAYAASKAGIVALSRSMAKEFAGNNIQVNVVAPGYINSPMNDPYKEALKMTTALHIPSKRLGEPWEVAETVWYIANSKSSYLTGSQIIIDGGLTLG